MGGSNIPIILSICQTPNCFLILRFNSSPSSISFWSQRTFLPPKCTSQLNRNFVVPSLQQSWCLDSFSKAECWYTENWPLWCQNSDPNHPGVLCWSKTICCCRLELWQRLLYYCSKLTQEMLDNCESCCWGFSMHTMAKNSFLGNKVQKCSSKTKNEWIPQCALQ